MQHIYKTEHITYMQHMYKNEVVHCIYAACMQERYAGCMQRAHMWHMHILQCMHHAHIVRTWSIFSVLHAFCTHAICGQNMCKLHAIYVHAAYNNVCTRVQDLTNCLRSQSGISANYVGLCKLGIETPG